MQGETSVSKPVLWTGRIVSGFAVLFLVVDGAMKLWKPAVVVETTKQLGFPESAITGIGIALLASMALYLFPRTAMWGAILLTGYLGGAVATHVRVSGGAFPILFPVVIAAMIWAGLWVRSSRLRSLLGGVT